MINELDHQDLEFKSDGVSYYRPTKLSTLLKLKQEFPQAKIIVGNTEVGKF